MRLAVPFDRYDLVIGAGAAAMCVGIGMIYRPAGIIAAGLALTLLGLLAAAKAERDAKGGPS